ncbi:MAG TPA: carboxypeptidase-like regulatory domain-containing protein [Mucilaginibacter sp.]|nr:carboxypeptidase-like regulatory domain-containing protein [Mucilaginibacter sp.]
MKPIIRHAILCAVFIICILPSITLAQTVYEGQVIDKTTELPIPAVTLTLIKKHFNTLTNDQGYFKLPANNTAVNDTIIFTSIGYQTYQLPVRDYKPYPYIKMQPTLTRLNQVNITARARKQKQVTLDKFLVSNSNFYKKTLMGVMVGNDKWTAKLFTLPTINTKLLSVQLGRDDLSDYFITTNKFARFNLHIMDIDSAKGSPGRILLTKEINLQDNSHMVLIDLSKDNLTLPSSKFFIAIERLFIPYNEVISIAPDYKAAGTNKKGEQILDDTPCYLIEYQPFLQPYPQPHAVSIWFYKNGSWVSHTFAAHVNTMALSATILY